MSTGDPGLAMRRRRSVCCRDALRLLLWPIWIITVLLLIAQAASPSPIFSASTARLTELLLPAAAGLVASALCARAAVRHDADTRRGWTWAAIAAGCTAVGHVVAVLAGTGSGSEPVDVATLFTVFAAATATGLLPGRPGGGGSREVLDGALLAVGTTALCLVGVQSTGGSAVHPFGAGHLGVAVTLASLALVGTRVGRQVSPRWASTLVASFALAELLARQLDDRLGAALLVLGLPQAGGFAMLGLAALHRHRIGAAEPSAPSSWPFLVPTAALALVGLYWRRGDSPAPATLVILLIAIGLALVRHLLALRDNASLIAEVAATRDRADRHDTFDLLTGLARRPLFTRRLHEALQRQVDDGSSIAVLLCDLDSFTALNDRLGHAVGDRLLAEAGHRLERRLPAAASMARLGGDEFAVLVERLHPKDAAARAGTLAEALRAAIDAPFQVDGIDVSMSVGVGVAVVDAQMPRPGAGEVLSRADVALHTAKRTDLRRPVVYSEGLTLPEEHDWLLRPALLHALADGGIVAHYQPVIELGNGRVRAVEALARWQRVGEAAAPAIFLPVLARAGALPDLTAHMLRLTTAQLAGWRRDGADPRMRVSVNVPPPLIGDPAFTDMVHAALDSAELPACGLILEITEDRLIEDLDAAARVVSSLQRLGVQVWLDDFGAGYSSLALLHRLPLNAVKLDKCLIATLHTDPWLRRLVGGVISLGDDLGLDVIAEGIDRGEQLDVLRDLGCTLGQGHRLSRPAPPRQLSARLLSHGLEGFGGLGGQSADHPLRLPTARTHGPGHSTTSAAAPAG